jgi:hypothetical protein
MYLHAGFFTESWFPGDAQLAISWESKVLPNAILLNQLRLLGFSSFELMR